MRSLLLRGPMVMRAPEDDSGAEYDDPIEDQDEAPEDQIEDEGEEDQQDDYQDEADDDEPPAQETRQRKSFAQRVEEVASRKTAELEARIRSELEGRFQQQTRQPVETPEQLNARLAAMEPWERAETISRMTADNVARQLAQMQADANESADKLAYEALASRVPQAAKLRDKVEEQLAAMRRNNVTAPRETILKYLIGEAALANASRATSRTQRQADSNRQRQAARPSGGRGDAAPSRGQDSRSARDKRLDGINI